MQLNNAGRQIGTMQWTCLECIDIRKLNTQRVQHNMQFTITSFVLPCHCDCQESSALLDVEHRKTFV